MNYQFGAARDLYERKAHPRIFIGSEDIPVLRAKIKSGVGRKIMNGIRGRVKLLTDRVLKAEDLSSLICVHNWLAQGRQGFPILYGLQDIALTGILDDNADAIEAALRVLRMTFDAQPMQRDDVISFRDNPIQKFALTYDLLHPFLSVAERRAFCRYAYACAVQFRFLPGQPDYLDYYKRAGQNMRIASLFNCLLTLMAIDGEPGVPDLSEHWTRLLRLLDASLNVEFHRNGYPEEDIGYGTLMAGWLSHAAEALRRAGIVDVYERCPGYARFGNAILHFVQPWGENLSNTGDHGDDFREREFILARLAQETKSPELVWLLGTLSYTWPGFHDEVTLRKGFRVPATTFSLLVMDAFRDSVAPARRRTATAFCERKRGIVSFRSGWRADDTFVAFDGSHHSPAGAWGHNHAAGGHFSISAMGEYFSIDTGRFNMEQSCHSVVLIGGKSGLTNRGLWSGWELKTGLLTEYLPGEFVDVAAVDSTAQHNCWWARRHIGLVKGLGAPAYVWTADDIGNQMDWGRAVFWWQLQTCPENTIRVHKRHATITGWRHGNLMDVHFAIPAPDEYPKPHRLLGITQDESMVSATKYIRNPKSAAKEYSRASDMVHGPVYVRPRLTAKIQGNIGRFMAVMLPRRKGDPPAAVERLKSPPLSLAVRIVFPDVEDILIFAYEHNVLEAADIKALGQWCVVRRRRHTGRIINYAVGQGASLTVKGRKMTLGAGSIERDAD